MDKGGLFTKNGKGAFGVGLWKDISKEAVVLKQFNNLVVGNGKRFRFWKDIWCGTKPLSETFHIIYTIAATKDANLEDLWDWSREEGGWNPTFLRSFHDWEINDVHPQSKAIMIGKTVWFGAYPRVAFLLSSPVMTSSWEGMWITPLES